MKNIIKKIILLFSILLVIGFGYSQFYEPSSERYTLDYSLKRQIENRIPHYVELNDIPDNLLNATIAMEDKRFYSHGGFDLIAISRATIADISEKKLVQGGSTITQQLAKNLFFNNTKSITRKINELIVATRLEYMFPKDIILEMYLNIIYYGAGAHGVTEASHTFFSKNVSDLSLEECAMLAGLPQAPSKYNPIDNFTRAKERQELVMRIMMKNGYIH